MFGRVIRTHFRVPRRTCIVNPIRTYAGSSSDQSPPRLRYLFYMFLASTGALYLAGKSVDGRKKPQNSFESERELKEYEQDTGLKRRSKMIPFEKNENYKFYVLPYVHSLEAVEKLSAQLAKLDGKVVKVLDPVTLIEAEKKDESKKYCFLLQDLDRSEQPLPKGLVTAIVKEEIQLFLNTRGAIFDTNFIIQNYPQTTEEAIKFENDISDVQKCLVYESDLNELSKGDAAGLHRSIENVVGYFDTVGKSERR